MRSNIEGNKRIVKDKIKKEANLSAKGYASFFKKVKEERVWGLPTATHGQNWHHRSDHAGSDDEHLNSDLLH